MKRVLEWTLVAATLIYGANAEFVVSGFSVYSDIYAKPQFDVNIHGPFDEPGYILQTDIQSILQSSDNATEYQLMVLHGRKYMCSIPRSGADSTDIIEGRAPQDEPMVSQPAESDSENGPSTNLALAKTKALELLQPLSNYCLYYPIGYWTYAICYGRDIRQFHPAPYQMGKPLVPKEGTAVYTLGQFDEADEMTSIKSTGSTNYASQMVRKGTVCDLTGEERTVEIQYFCSPRVSSDTVMMVKEVKTCHYRVVINTPRLCSDVAFSPPKEPGVHEVSCRPIVSDEQQVSDLLDETLPSFHQFELGGLLTAGDPSESATDQQQDEDADEIVVTVDKVDGRVVTLSVNNLLKNMAHDDNFDLSEGLAILADNVLMEIQKGTMLIDGRPVTADDEFSISFNLHDASGSPIATVEISLKDGTLKATVVEFDEDDTTDGDGDTTDGEDDTTDDRDDTADDKDDTTYDKDDTIDDKDDTTDDKEDLMDENTD
jgi:hypothetical protein